MSNAEPDKEALKAELDQIKEAMGLHERYPYWTRRWLTEGIGIGIGGTMLQIAVQIVAHEMLPLVWAWIVLGGAVIVLLVTVRWGWTVTERPTGGTPDWETWGRTIGAGMVALMIGLIPFLQSSENTLIQGIVVGFSILGVGYMFMAQLLKQYRIRNRDRYTFYVGGLWILVLVAVIPYIPILREWSLAVISMGIAVHHISSYVYLSKL